MGIETILLVIGGAIVIAIVAAAIRSRRNR
jgi:hypothetical protein